MKTKEYIIKNKLKEYSEQQYDGKHSECYPLYVLDTFDGDELTSERYYI